MQTSKGDFLKNPGMMEERSTFESEEFTLEEEGKQQKDVKIPGKKRSLSDVADDSVNLPPEESKGDEEEPLTPEEA